MAALSVRVSEDPARPLGHAIVTLGGLPRGLETFEFALSRHGFAANHLGPDGWQGAECWLQPEEAWFSGELLKFVIHPDLVFQLENMPYQLAVRGQGLTGTATSTFVWPLQLELEEGGAGGERKVVGGTRVNPGPTSRPEPARAVPAVEPPPLPLPEVGGADLKIPDMPIPEIGAGLDAGDEDRTRLAPPRLKDSKPRDSTGLGRTPTASPQASEAVVPAEDDLTRKAPGRVVPLPAARRADAVAGDGVETKSASPVAGGEPPIRAEPPRLGSGPPPFEPGPSGAAAARRGKSGMLAGLLGLVALAALAAFGWWWFGRSAGEKPPIPLPDKPAAPIPSTPPTGSRLTPELLRNRPHDRTSAHGRGSLPIPPHGLVHRFVRLRIRSPNPRP